MTDSQFAWMRGMSAVYTPTPEPIADDGDAPDPVPGTIQEVRDVTPDQDERHIRVVLKTETGLVDIGRDRVEVRQ
jgi:hypothetical protein